MDKTHEQTLYQKRICRYPRAYDNVLSILSHRANANPNHNDVHFKVPTAISTNTNKPTDNNKGWWAHGTLRILTPAKGSVKWPHRKLFGETIWQFYVKLDTLPPHDPLLCLYSRETYFHRNTCSSTCMAEFIETENRLVVPRGGGGEWVNVVKRCQIKKKFITILFKIDKNKKYPKCPSTGQWESNGDIVRQWNNIQQ